MTPEQTTFSILNFAGGKEGLPLTQISKVNISVPVQFHHMGEGVIVPTDTSMPG